jgi:hypothetical protein
MNGGDRSPAIFMAAMWLAMDLVKIAATSVADLMDVCAVAGLTPQRRAARDLVAYEGAV